ncbi:Fe-S cluster assembly protein SufD [Acetobacter conturbans]|uniref:Fe-S cluster assembly protein SufD n=1 Tax=Acetobacter conturbans TaxID=1737472 RepID=A0ABX0K1Q0_9PROT|nr:Fe-S cluster assembly protein SufD [Acetobacter conturbans]NHN89175.1 Fe-S cluster assembly protein SufD [Acetobacter conturbans]
MNVITPIGRSLTPFAARLSGLKDADRKAAAGELARVGLPTPHVEAWHYTNLRALSGRVFSAPAAGFDEAAAQKALAGILADNGGLAGLPRLVLVNGAFAPSLSSAEFPAGIVFTSFARSPDFGTQTAPDRDALVALNTALAGDGIRLSVKPHVNAGRIVFISLAMGLEEDISFHPRHAVEVGEGARLSLIEIAVTVEKHAGAYLHNPVLTSVIAEGAHLTHVKIQHEADQAVHLATVYADVASRATYDSFTLGLGSVLARHEVHVTLRGDHAGVHVNGAQLLGGEQVGDITSVITHGAPDCISRQTVRNVLTDRARAVFQGKVLVERVAQKTDGYQMNQALLLSPTSEIDAKPELEIYADDVKCSHGATVGALDEDQLFYLRSRGVPDAQARQMLVEAFLVETVDLVEDETAHVILLQALEKALTERVGAPEKTA